MAKLYLVPTPIGNLEDITLRAIRILKEVDTILAEDTRKTKILLNHFEIQNKIISYHKYNEHKILNSVIKRIKDGEKMALVTNAGTPAISDPGYLLIKECLNNGIEIECLPGATALIPALVNSGFANDRFVFEGFLPVKKGRNAKLKSLINQPYTMIFYESPHRLMKTLNQFKNLFGNDKKICICRELTKIHEENIRGTILQIIEYFSEKNIKGEVIIILEGAK